MSGSGFLFRGLFLFFYCKSTAASMCLADGVPPEKRSNTTVDGKSMALGVYALNWDSSFLMSEVYMILTKEILGLNTVLSGTGNVINDALHAMSRCTKLSNGSWVDCGNKVTSNHIAFDVWMAGNYMAYFHQLQQEYPTTACNNLGSLGYTGIEGVYIKASIVQDAWTRRGKPLEYYKTYDGAWNDVTRFFNNINDIPDQQMSQIAASQIAEVHNIFAYQRLTGDIAGYTKQSDGKLQIDSVRGIWWTTQACRQNSSKCIPFITGGAPGGWALPVVQQKAAFHNMPLALGVASSWANYVSLPRKLNILSYWWQPDTTFIDLNFLPIVFPPFNEQEWNNNNMRSASDAQICSKFADYNLAGFSGVAYTIARNMEIYDETLSALLYDLKNKSNLVDKGLLPQDAASYFSIACDWIKANNATWSQWVPDDTQCYEGFGLVDKVGPKSLSSQS